MPNTVIHLDPALVPPALRGAYNGRKFKAVVCLEHTIPLDAGLWSGGTRDYYSAIELATGKALPIPGQSRAPDNTRKDQHVEIKPGFVLVRHSMFCGKDMGLTFYVHPENAARMLPAPQDQLTDNEQMVLNATASYKSSYNGMDRYEMVARDYQYKDKAMPSRADWNNAKESLINKGLLNKAGAITVAGRNARTR